MLRGALFSSIMLLVLSAAGAIAADVAPESPPTPDSTPTPWRGTVLMHQWQPGIPDSPALHVDRPITRDDQVEQVTLKQAIGIALQNNPGIAAQRLEPERIGTGILQTQAQFDPALAGSLAYNRSVTPNASSLSGTTTSVIEDRSANAHLYKTFRSGTAVTIDFLNDRLDNNATFNALRPQYVPQLNFSLVQPLLRNFGWDFSYLVVRVAEQTADAAVYSYEAQLSDFVQAVIIAYWAVVGTRENLEVQRESKALADRTVEENQARVRVGLLPPVAVLEAQADAASREEQVIVAENRLVIARQHLAQLAYYRPRDTFVPRTLEPTDQAMPEDLKVNLDEAIAVAIDERPEIQASARNVRAQQLNERVAENGLLPKLDLIGSYGVNGLSGTDGRQFPSSRDIPGFNCTPVGEGFVCRSVSPFAGPRGDAYERLTSNDFNTYAVGLQFQMPLSNALARSQYTQSHIALSQAELNHRDLLSRVTLDVRQAASDVQTTRQRIDTSRIARELAVENLRNQEKRHEVGMATTKDLLDFQSQLTSARAAEVQAKIDHAISVAGWKHAQGRLLQAFQIVVEGPGHHVPPWFARF
jgi:outer membrane protein